MTVTISFMNSKGDRLKKINMSMSHFELILESFGFEGHSKNEYWDYDKYEHVKNKTLTRMLWFSLLKHGYILFEHTVWANIEGGITNFLVV